MGNKNSSSNKEADVVSRCGFCGCSTKDAAATEFSYSICNRCGGAVNTTTPGGGGGTRRPDNYTSLDMKSDDVQLPLRIVSFVPFEETLPSAGDDAIWTEAKVVGEYLQPYFQDRHIYIENGSRFQINGVDFRVVACQPPSGLITNDTKIRCTDRPFLSALNTIIKVHILPTRASLPPEAKDLDPKTLFETYIKPYFSQETRHLMEGDTFMSNGMQFKVLACNPKNGQVTRDTEIFTEGAPLMDIQKMDLIPIYETLPNNEKEINTADRFTKYLSPYFSGRSRYIQKDATIEIDGVEWQVMDCVPSRGIVTNDTVLFSTGAPAIADDIKNAQMARDEELARQLQEQEAGRFGYMNPMMRFGGHSPGELRLRLQQILRTMPENHPHRRMVRTMHDQLALLQYMAPHAYDQTAVEFMRQAAHLSSQVAPEQKGATAQEISALPTRTYVAPSKEEKDQDGKSDTPSTATQEKVATDPESKQAEFDKNHTKCIVCYEDFQDGETLRTLPCFHSYHKDCIDTWLQMKNKCPICQTPVS